MMTSTQIPNYDVKDLNLAGAGKTRIECCREKTPVIHLLPAIVVLAHGRLFLGLANHNRIGGFGNIAEGAARLHKAVRRPRRASEFPTEDQHELRSRRVPVEAQEAEQIEVRLW